MGLRTALLQSTWAFICSFEGNLLLTISFIEVSFTFNAPQNLLDESDPIQAEALNAIKTRFRQETFTRQSIMEVIVAYPQLVRALI